MDESCFLIEASILVRVLIPDKSQYMFVCEILS